MWGEKTLLFALTFPIFDLVHMQVILSDFYIDEQLFTQTAFTRQLLYRLREQLLPEQPVTR